MEQRNQVPRGSGIRRYAGYVKGYWLPTLLTPFFMIFEVALEVLIPLLMAAIVDGGLYARDDFLLRSLIPAELKTGSTQLIFTLGGLMVLAALLSLSCGMLGARTGAVAAMGFAKNLRRSIFEKIQSFSFANTDKFSTSSLIVRTTTDVTMIQNVFQQMIRIFVRAPMMMVFAAIMAFNINSELSWIFVIAIPFLAVAMVILVKTGHPRFMKMLKKTDAMNTSVQEDLIAMRVVKAFVREDYEKQRFHDSVQDLKNAQIHAQKIFTFSGPIQLIIMWTCTIILLALGGMRIIRFKAFGPGELTSLMTYTTQIISSLAMVSFIIVSLSMAKASVSRINEVLDEELDIIGPDSDLKVENGDIEFRNVDFSYTGDPNNLTLSGINFKIRSGETIGVVGGTGEGKSTLVQLIPRFYDVLSGEVLIAGHNVKDYSLFELREGVSMVLQKNMLFSGSIKENLRWGDPNATDEEIVEACKMACAHDFITRMENGYDTDLGQGGCNVSGGQKQRLCIARALLKKPKILILDDSTSAVDTATDEKIRRAFRDYIPGTTKLIIAQRIASIMDSDRIIVMDEGKVVDIGTHDELMRRSVIYREVYESQMEGDDE
ncbi:MAG: ABC transporter ATP-binding protein [Clostridia bacterium]|nr:ABC transporter ATP-binding protein [Clostridia bacterium]